VVILYSFWLLTAGCALYGVVRGGRSGRWAVTIFVSGALLTGLVTLRDPDWHDTVYPILWIDLACLLGFLIVALRSRHYWPLWFSAFHLVAVGVHLATIVRPNYMPKAYAALQTFWSIPMLLVMVRGIVLDRRVMKRRARWPRSSVT
jgi:hypothetical protein